MALALAMTVGMAPATVYAAPDGNAWSAEADSELFAADESALETGDADRNKPEDGTGQDSGYMEPEEPAGAEDTGTEDSGNAKPEESAGAEDSGTGDSGKVEPEEPAGAEDGGTGDSGNAKPEGLPERRIAEPGTAAKRSLRNLPGRKTAATRSLRNLPGRRMPAVRSLRNLSERRTSELRNRKCR